MQRRTWYFVEGSVVVVVLALLLIFMIPQFVEVNANINTPSHIPDEKFRRAITDLMGVEPGTMYTKEEASVWSGKVKHIDVSGLGIQSLEGIQFFDQVYFLSCHNNQISKLNVPSFNDLRVLSAGSNQIDEVTFSSEMRLKILELGNTQIEYIDLAHCGILEFLGVSGNKLHELDVRNLPLLKSIDASDNLIQELDFSANPELRELNLLRNPLDTLTLHPEHVVRKLYVQETNIPLDSLSAIKDHHYPELLVASHDETDTVDASFINEMEEAFGEPMLGSKGEPLTGFHLLPE